jgi:hypothetical protein
MYMNIRPISSGELDAFSAFGRDAERAASVRNYLKQMLTNGSMRTEWCFVAKDSDRLLGTIGLWTISGPSLDHLRAGGANGLRPAGSALGAR